MADARIPIGLQLYSVRDDAAKDLFATIAEVASLGYDGVEFAGFFGKEAADIKKCLDDNGLKCCGSHAGWNTLQDDQLEATVAFHKAIGCDYLVIPWIPEEMRNTPEAALKTAEHLTALTEKLRAHGVQTGFHAHDGDMRPLAGGESAWYIIGKNTPADFILQYDTHNGMAGGADPVQPILDFPGRGTTLHLKERKGTEGAVIGTGDIPWDKVLEAAEKVAGLKWYIVEYEMTSGQRPMDACGDCLKALRAMGR